jgi:hypothetical protein
MKWCKKCCKSKTEEVTGKRTQPARSNMLANSLIFYYLTSGW